MRLHVNPGASVGGTVAVPGDKSIAHRWLLLSATAIGSSRLVGLPASLDVGSTAGAIAALAPSARPALDAWARKDGPRAEGHGSTWNAVGAVGASTTLEVEGEGRAALVEPRGELDCGNSGTAMRLLAGVAAPARFRTVLIGDESLSRRPMERVAEPLRAMGAGVRTTDGHAPVVIDGGGPLRGIRYAMPVASAQVKSAVLLAGLAAEGPTTVTEPSATRDHTERAIASLGGRIDRTGGSVTVWPFQHGGLHGRVPGDPSSAAFLVAAAVVTGAELVVTDLGLNPTRLGFLEVLRRMGVEAVVEPTHEELGEPVGTLTVRPAVRVSGTRVSRDELPRVIDEVPALAAVAAHAVGPSRFEGGAELRVKESDRLAGLARGLRGLGGDTAVEGDDLVVAGGGLRGGSVDAGDDHRLAMALAVAALAGRDASTVAGAQIAEVSYPGFTRDLASLGAFLEPEEDP
jgi:3-phosphoshikimate 1-carboxyvinyltransferase